MQITLGFDLLRGIDSLFLSPASAIDNATRGLINLGQLPVTCGLFFSLGHSTVVIVVVGCKPHTPKLFSQYKECRYRNIIEHLQ